ncbi:MAG: hypothetical protein WHS46_02800 [Desulfosoma sp.]
MPQSSHSAAVLRLAWEEALRARGCPPEAVLLADPIPEALQRHLSACPWCDQERDALLRNRAHKSEGKALCGTPSHRIAQDAGEAPAFSGKDPRCDGVSGICLNIFDPDRTKDFKPAAVNASKSPGPGDVVRLQPDLAGWGPRSRFYNAPLVLVLESVEETASAFRVALVHDFPDLAGPGDVEVLPGIFVEPWNTFACLKEHVSDPIFTVSNALLNVIHQKAQNLSQAVLCDEISTQSPFASFLSAFQRLEVEVASFFAQRTLETLMAFQENPTAWTLDSFFRDRKTFRKTFSPWLQLDPDSQPTVKTLLTAPWVEEVLPLAAAPARETVPVRLLRLSDESAPVLKPAGAEITVLQSSAKGVLVGGRILEPLSDVASIYGLWIVSDGELEPLESALDGSTGYFRLLFPVSKKYQPLLQDLRLLVVDR